MELTPEQIHPFIRCVGRGTELHQGEPHAAYDHRLICALNGEGTFYCEEAAHRAERGTLCLIAPGVPYRVCSEPGQQVIVVNFDWTQTCVSQRAPVLSVPQRIFAPERILQKVGWSCLFPEPDAVFMRVSEKSVSLAEQLCSCYLSGETESAGKDLVLSGLFMQLLGRMTSEATGVRLAPHSGAERLYEYIRAHYSEPLTLASLSEVFHFHPSYINRILHARYGTSFRQLLIQCRLLQAITLLENTDWPVQEIASAVGFYNGKHLSEAFRKRYGETPAQYRE